MSVKPKQEYSLGAKVLNQAITNAVHKLNLPAGQLVCVGQAISKGDVGEAFTVNLSAGYVNLGNLKPSLPAGAEAENGWANSNLMGSSDKLPSEESEDPTYHALLPSQSSGTSVPTITTTGAITTTGTLPNTGWIYNPSVTVPYHYEYGDPPPNSQPWVGDPNAIPNGAPYYPGSGGVYPNPIPQDGGTWLPFGFPYPEFNDPVQIKKLLDELNKLVKDKKIKIGDPELQEAAKQELKHEPTEDEMDEIRRQIRDETLDGLFVERQF